MPKSIRDRIDDQWNLLEKQRTVKTDWLELEQILRDILRSDTIISNNIKLHYIDEAIGAWTGRGQEFKPIN